MKENEVYEQITKMVDWYNKSGYNSDDIPKLLEFTGRLSGLNYYLSSIVAEFKKNYNGVRFIRKMEFSRSKLEFRAGGDTLGDAEERATEKHKDLYEKEYEIEAAAYQAETMQKSIYTIIDVIRTRVSYLKTEQQTTRSDV